MKTTHEERRRGAELGEEGMRGGVGSRREGRAGKGLKTRWRHKKRIGH